jgi:putative flippase GtrA
VRIEPSGAPAAPVPEPQPWRQFLLFCIAGTIGFLVDAGIVQALVAQGADPYLARLLSFLCALTATWAFNRRYTFGAVRSDRAGREWLRYFIAMLGGFAVNYAVYAALVYSLPTIRQWPALGVAAGSIAGLVVNYLSSRFWVFRASAPPPG